MALFKPSIKKISGLLLQSRDSDTEKKKSVTEKLREKIRGTEVGCHFSFSIHEEKYQDY